MEEEDFKKLSVEERCCHKLWQARKDGYEEVCKTFRQIDDEKSPEFGKYLGLVKKFVVDSHAVCQEKGLEATLAFVENYAHAGKTVGEVMSGIISKCVAAPKQRTRELALQLILMYIEIEKGEIVLEELLKGTEQKNPKIVAACIAACHESLRQFGSKVVNVKPLVKKMPALCSDRDKTVREEAKGMIVEIYRWIGGALRSQLNTLKPVQISELETEFAKVEGQKASPQRFIRSEQQKQAMHHPSGDGGDDIDAAGSDEAQDDEEQPEMDPYDLCDPVDILSQLPKDFYEKIEAKKWQERKEALEALENLVKNPKLQNGDYGDLVRALKKVIDKDSNVVVVALGGRCLAGVASGLKKRFQPYAGACVPSLLEKFKEKKQNVVSAIKEAIDIIYLTTSLEAILENTIEALGNKNPSVKTETSLFLARALTKTQPTAVNKKTLKALCTPLVKNINESDPGVRDASAEALGTLMKLVGEKSIGPFLIELEKDTLKMTKIKECCDKAQITVKIQAPKKERPATAPPAKSKPLKVPKSNSATSSKPKQKTLPSKSASTNSLDKDEEGRVDISNQLTPTLLDELEAKSWKERTEALNKISQIVVDAKCIEARLEDLPTALTKRLSDSNKQVAQTALNVCAVLAKALGPQCKQYTKTFFPFFLRSWGDNKAQLRAAAKETIDCFAEQAGGYREFFESEMIADALKTGTPQLKIELWDWLADILPKIPVKAVPKEEIVICIPILYSHFEDRMSDIRTNSKKAILGVMIHAGYETMLKHVEKLKPGSQLDAKKLLEAERGNLPIQSIPAEPKKATAQKTVRGTKAVANAKNAVKKPTTTATTTKQTTGSNKKKDEDIDTSPLLVVNNMKHQRTIDESKLKVLKWNFTTPREEFVELLREQMLVAHVNKNLISHMFHTDFSYHIKALDLLMDDMQDNSQALISNLDLILKWLTLRFFDTNPSVMFKGLEYLHSVFGLLADNEYKMLESEAASFLPYLVLKIGDAKFCNGVRSLFKQICHVYPVGRVFTYIMEGVKSKNARQRAECLEVMGTIIRDYGIAVCGSSPAPVLKEVAKQISDKDKAVRNAALNCMVEAYNILGDKVYKMIGNILGKDLSLLESRIKHSKRPTAIVKPDIPEPGPSSRPDSPKEMADEELKDEDEEEEEQELPPVALPPRMEAQQQKGPFSLDTELIARLDKLAQPVQMRKVQTFDLEFLNDNIQIPVLSAADMKSKIMPLSPPKPLDPNLGIRTTSDRSKHVDKQDPLLASTIHMIGSIDPNICSQGLIQIIDFLQGIRASNMQNYEDEFISAIVTQLRFLKNQDPVTNRECARNYRNILTAVDSLYKVCGQNISVENIKAIIDEFIYVLVDGKLEKSPNGDSYVRVINLHCVKFIEKTEHTRAVCALVQLMHHCVRMDREPRHTELVMKCLWRVIKIMPTWENLEYSAILVDVHNFLKEFPSVWWKNKPTDTPLRTIKTILHSAVKVKGAALMTYFHKIPNPSESEIETYVLKLLNNIKLDPVTHSAPALTKSTHAILTDIFQKIGNKDETREGLILLYDFIQQHPEADVDSFLKKSSKFFQDYIQNGLQEIADSRKKTIDEVGKKTEMIRAPPPTTNGDEKGLEYWEERINSWKKYWKGEGEEPK